MRRRRRRLLNLFAFSLLGAAIYLNLFHMNDTDGFPINQAGVVKTEIKPPLQKVADSKPLLKPQHKK